MRKAVTTAAVLSAMFALAPLAAQGGPDGGTPAPAAASAEHEGDPYMLENCPVSGKQLGSEGAIVYRRLEGRDLRFCTRGCVRKFERNLKKYVRQMDAELVRLQRPHYPLDTCIITGEKLGSMGEPVDHIYRNRLVRFCCEPCIEKFERNASEYMARLDAAVIEKQKPSYPLTTCIVSGNDLSSIEPVEFVMGNRLFRVCCTGCVTSVKTTPFVYINKLDEAQGRGRTATVR